MALMYLCITWLTGFLLIRTTGIFRYNNKIVAGALGFPAGAAMVSIVFFILNLAFGIHPGKQSSWMIPVVFSGILFCVYLLKPRSANHSGVPDGSVPVMIHDSGINSERLFFLAIILFTCAFSVLIPVKNWDSFLYHLPYAEYILKTGTLPAGATPSYHLMTNAYPPLIFIYYALTWSVTGNMNLLIPKTICYLFFLSLLILQWHMGRNILNWSSAKTFLVFLIELSCYPVFQSVIDENTDMPFAFFCIASLYFYLQYCSSDRNSDLYISVISSAMAGWVRYHGFVWFVILLVMMTVRGIRHSSINPGRIIRCIGIFTVLVSPFTIRNHILYGNPFYPAFPHILDGYQMDSWTLENIVSFYHPGIPFTGLSILIFLRFIFLFPVPFALIEYASAGHKDRPYLNTLMRFGIVYLVFWGALMIAPNSGEPLRFLLPSLIIFSMFAGEFRIFLYPFESDTPPTGRLILITITAVILQVIFTASRMNHILQPFHDYFPLGKTGPSTYKQTLYYVFAILRNYFWLWVLLLLIMPIWSRKYFKTPPDFVVRICHILFYTVLLLSIILPSLHQIWPDENSLVAYNWWNERPLLNPGGAWIENNLPQNAVLLSFDDRKFIVPRPIFPADSPVLKPLYIKSVRPGSALQLLKENHITHILITGVFEHLHPLFKKSPLFRFMRLNPYVKLIYHEGKTEIYTIVYPSNSEPDPEHLKR